MDRRITLTVTQSEYMPAPWTYMSLITQFFYSRFNCPDKWSLVFDVNDKGNTDCDSVLIPYNTECTVKGTVGIDNISLRVSFLYNTFHPLVIRGTVRCGWFDAKVTSSGYEDYYRVSGLIESCITTFDYSRELVLHQTCSDALSHIYSHIDRVSDENSLRRVCRTFYRADTITIVRLVINRKGRPKHFPQKINTLLLITPDGSINNNCGLVRFSRVMYHVTGHYTRDKLSLSFKNDVITYNGTFDIACDSIVTGLIKDVVKGAKYRGSITFLRRPINNSHTCYYSFSNPSSKIPFVPHKFSLGITVNDNGTLHSNAVMNNVMIRCEGRANDGLFSIKLNCELEITIRKGSDRATLVRDDNSAEYDVIIEQGNVTLM